MRPKLIAADLSPPCPVGKQFKYIVVRLALLKYTMLLAFDSRESMLKRPVRICIRPQTEYGSIPPFHPPPPLSSPPPPDPPTAITFLLRGPRLRQRIAAAYVVAVSFRCLKISVT